MAKFFKGLAYVWFVLVGALLVISSVFIIYKDGFWTFAQIMSPFNVTNLILELLALSPGVAALLLSQWLEKRKSSASRL